MYILNNIYNDDETNIKDCEYGKNIQNVIIGIVIIMYNKLKMIANIFYMEKWA